MLVEHALALVGLPPGWPVIPDLQAVEMVIIL